MLKTLWAVACAAVMMPWIAPAPGDCGTTDSAEIRAVQQTPAGAPASVAPPADYKIGPEDVLQISVWENKELTLSVMVRPDGYISFPLIQDVLAEGITAAELGSIIQKKLLDFIKEPQVAVIVTQVNAPKVYVIGNVAKPGPIALRGELSVLQALSMAGGFTEFASTRKIRIVRGSGTRQEIRKINYSRLLEPGGEGNYMLKPGDTIVVP